MREKNFPIGYRRCPGCGAANYGRNTSCLLCQGELPGKPVAGKGGRVSKARFCTRCGKPLAAKQTTRYCHHCGAPVFVPPKARG